MTEARIVLRADTNCTSPWNDIHTELSIYLEVNSREQTEYQRTVVLRGIPILITLQTNSTHIDTTPQHRPALNMMPHLVPYSGMPAEIILQIVHTLDPFYSVPLRLLNKAWNAFFDGKLDSVIFREFTLFLTERSFTNLEALSKSRFACYLQTIRLRTTLLEPHHDDPWRFRQTYLIRFVIPRLIQNDHFTDKKQLSWNDPQLQPTL